MKNNLLQLLISRRGSLLITRGPKPPTEYEKMGIELIPERVGEADINRAKRMKKVMTIFSLLFFFTYLLPLILIDIVLRDRYSEDSLSLVMGLLIFAPFIYLVVMLPLYNTKIISEKGFYRSAKKARWRYADIAFASLLFIFTLPFIPLLTSIFTFIKGESKFDKKYSVIIFLISLLVTRNYLISIFN